MPSLLSHTYLIPLEKGLNKLIRMDNKAVAQIAALDGSVIAIQSTSPNYTFFIIPTEDGLFLSSQCDTSIDAKLTAPAPLLLQLLLAKNKQAMLRESNIMIVGQSSILYQLFDVFDSLEPDWQNELKRWFPTNIANLLEQSVHFGQAQAKQTFSIIQSQFLDLFNSDVETKQTSDKTTENPLTGFITSLQNKLRRY